MQTIDRCQGCNKQLLSGMAAFEAAMEYLFCIDCCVPVVVTKDHDLQLVLN